MQEGKMDANQNSSETMREVNLGFKKYINNPHQFTS